MHLMTISTTRAKAATDTVTNEARSLLLGIHIAYIAGPKSKISMQTKIKKHHAEWSMTFFSAAIFPSDRQYDALSPLPRVSLLMGVTDDETLDDGRPAMIMLFDR